MVIGNIVTITKRRVEIMVLIGALLSAFGFLAVVTTEKNYRSTIDILIVQNQEGFSDYYALSKSADYLSRVLSESIYSEKFIDEAAATGKLSGFQLPNDKVERLEGWKKSVSVSRKADTGILQIVLRGDNPQQLNQAASGVMEVLTSKQSLFLGRGQNVEVRVLSGPLIEKNFTLSQIFVVIGGGFVLGALVSFIGFFYKDKAAPEGKADNASFIKSAGRQVDAVADINTTGQPVTSAPVAEERTFLESVLADSDEIQNSVYDNSNNSDQPGDIDKQDRNIGQMVNYL